MQRDKEDNVRHELDDQFAALRELIYAPDPSSSGSNAVPLGARETGFKAPAEPDAEPAAADTGVDANANDYDQHVRELAFDKRAKPKDRTKTEEELALEAKEALEKAERRRRKRMLGIDGESSDEEEGKAMGKRKRGADDLDDDFDEEGVPDYDGLGAGLAAKAGSEDEDEDDEEGSDKDEEDLEEGSEEGSEGEGSEVGDEDESDDNSEGEGEHEQLVAFSKITKGRSKGKKSAKQELPFTFPCPASHEEFLEIVEDVDDDDVATVIQRIRALYHTSLGAENKFKLQVCINYYNLSGTLVLTFFARRWRQYSLTTFYTSPLLQHPVSLLSTPYSPTSSPSPAPIL